jgi:hypothetical protein
MVSRRAMSLRSVRKLVGLFHLSRLLAQTELEELFADLANLGQ